MTTYNYVIIADSESSKIKRFKAVKMAPQLRRTDDFKPTLGGRLDKAVGVILEYFTYTFRVPAESSDSNYGTLDDLTYFFKLNNPNGAPSDLLSFTDHYGLSHYVKFQDDMAPEPLTTQLEGVNAWHFVNITLVKIDLGGS